jgi:hypothetical protein
LTSSFYGPDVKTSMPVRPSGNAHPCQALITTIGDFDIEQGQSGKNYPRIDIRVMENDVNESLK